MADKLIKVKQVVDSSECCMLAVCISGMPITRKEVLDSDHVTHGCVGSRRQVFPVPGYA